MQQFRRDDEMGVFSKEEGTAILDLMAKMLMFKPEDRPTIEQVLESGWMVKWGGLYYREACRRDSSCHEWL